MIGMLNKKASGATNVPRNCLSLFSLLSFILRCLAFSVVTDSGMSGITRLIKTYITYEWN